MKKIGAILIALVASLFFLNKGIEGAERHECYKWKANEAAGYYTVQYADWQRAQCLHHGIE